MPTYRFYKEKKGKITILFMDKVDQFNTFAHAIETFK